MKIELEWDKKTKTATAFVYLNILEKFLWMFMTAPLRIDIRGVGGSLAVIPDKEDEVSNG